MREIARDLNGAFSVIVLVMCHLSFLQLVWLLWLKCRWYEATALSVLQISHDV